MHPRPSLPARLWAVGAAALVFCARLREIHQYTGDVALNDQWKIEAADILSPWINGTLGPWAFFAPHFEHVPMWSRLLSWLEVMVSGRWDPFLQTTVNAALYAGFVLLLVDWVIRHLRTAEAIGFTLLLVLGSSLPHAWENITWGFQSQFPFALIFLFLHVRGSFAHDCGSHNWWWAQAAGLAGLFTLASLWIAPLAIVLTWLWTRARGPRRQLVVPAGIAATGLAIILVIRATATPQGAFAQTAGSPLHFLNAFLDFLGWPAGWPGAFAVLNLPLLVFALQLRGRVPASAFDRTVLALGLWGAGQAAALAYARSADYSGYVSRYGELLNLLVLANALAFVRLAGAFRWRPVAVACALGWTGVVMAGWWNLSTGGHTRYFHMYAVSNAKIRREAVQAYLQRQDRSLLELQGTRWVLYQVVDQVTSLLDDPRFRALLPASVNPANPPDTAGRLVRALQARALPLGLAAGIMLLGGMVWSVRTATGRAPLAELDFQTTPGLPWIALATALAAAALLFYWPDPFTFNPSTRWRLLLLPPGNVGPLDVQITAGSQVYEPDRLIGAALIDPPELRALFTGTHPEGTALTCTAVGRAFPVYTPWIVVPHAGWPVANGNGLRLRIEEADGQFITEVECMGPNPQAIGFWTADVRDYAGKMARLVLYDGRTGTEAWVAASPPIATQNADLATTLSRRMQREQLRPLHTSLGVLSLISALGAGVAWWSNRRSLNRASN
jgi:hypothetical protein